MVSDRILGVEGGGTKTAWTLLKPASAGAAVVAGSGRLPPTNLRLTSPARLQEILRQLPRDADRVGVFLAGCVTAEDRQELHRTCSAIWPAARLVVGSDRDSGLAAGLADRDGVVANAGTGASVTGRRGDQIEKAGGWGHILGDTGGGYFVSLQALRLILREYDLRRGEVHFAGKILSALSLKTLDDLVRWAQTAEKMEIAKLSPVVFETAVAGDLPVQEIIASSAKTLAEYAGAVAARLELEAPEVRLQGGLFQGQPFYVDAFSHALMEAWPAAKVSLSERSPEDGAAWLAAQAPARNTSRPVVVADDPGSSSARTVGPNEDLSIASTEQSNTRSAALERMKASEIVSLFVSEEAVVQEALRAAAPELSRAVELVATAISGGGRLFYLGAGTSGRLGVLDASEIPPTFGTSPEQVQGIIAGGDSALVRSSEGLEDERGGSISALQGHGLSKQDVVCGVSASGRTPFVLGGLEFARSVGATTILLTCNPGSSRAIPLDLRIDLPTGAEIVTGSTRLKAGTATKVALNIISTGAMVLLGKVRGNDMIDLSASNTKLRHRAARALVSQRGCSYDEAVSRLEKNNWNLRAALTADDV